MVSVEQIVNQLDLLEPDSLAELARFIDYLKWKQDPSPTQPGGRSWQYDFVEHFRLAAVSSERDPAGMEVQVGEAVCDGDSRMALWQHPPVQGASIVEYQVPVPPQVGKMRLHFATGIRDGSKLADGNVVAFRVFVNDWRLWSDTQHARAWRSHQAALPTLPGDMVRIKFVTDGLGNHQWAWAVWGEPRILGETEG